MGKAKNLLSRGVPRAGRAASLKQSGRHAFFKKGGKKEDKKVEEKKPEREPRFYAADDLKKPKVSRKRARPTKLRASLVPGTIVILLAGRFRGKRVVFLKQLPSGLLLVTGPYKINGVPLRRVNQAYVIATSTRIPVDGVDTSKISDEFFKKQQQAKGKKSDEAFFKDEQKKTPLSAERKAAQKAVDGKLLPLIKKQQYLGAYLNAKFSLRNGQYPHLMKF